MCLEYFKPGTLKGAKGDDEYIRKVFSIGDTTDHLVQTRVLNSYGIKSSFNYHLSFYDLDRELEEEKPVVIGILHRGTLSRPTGGHMCVVIGKTPAGDYVVNDPYGDLNDGYTSSVYNGKGAIYKRSVLEKRWTPEGANSGWGRIFESPTNNTNEAKNTNEVPLVGVNLIKEFEGCHLEAYPDPLTGGLPITIGWGSTRDENGKPFKLGTKISQATADNLLISQIKNEFLPPLTKIPYWNQMNMNQRGALLSFAYNLGARFYGSSGFNTISRVLKNKQWNKVPDALYLYRNPGTNVEAGLARRRKAEGNLWMS
jgi:lysozyme